MFATILRYFPTWSESFVYYETRALRQLVSLEVVVVRRPFRGPALTDSVLGGKVLRVPSGLAYFRIFFTFLGFLLSQPKRTVRAFLWGRQHLKLKTCLKAFWIAECLHRRHIRLFHVHFAGEGAEIAELTRQLTGIPYCVTLHARDLFVPRRSLRQLLASCCKIICISHYNKGWLVEHYGSAIAQKATVVHLGVPVPHVLPIPQDRPDFHVMMVGRLVEKKGVFTLLHAVCRLKQEINNLRVSLVGDGPLRSQVTELIQTLALGSVVRWWGLQPQSRIQQLYQEGCDVFVLPCRVASDGDQDGIPVALMEAMAWGLPVISTDISGIPELITDGVEGLLVPPDNVPALADAIKALYLQPNLRKQLGQNGFQKVSEHFNLELSVRSVESVLVQAAHLSHFATAQPVL